MKHTYMVDLGVDICAYSTIAIQADEPLDSSSLIALAKKAVEDGVCDGKDVLFTPNWESQDSLRIVSAKEIGSENVPLVDLAIDPQYHEAGQAASLFLAGQISLKELVNAAASAKVIDDFEVETFAGYVRLPGQPPVQVGFQCRRGASQAEKDLAMLSAMVSAAEVEYLSIG